MTSKTIKSYNYNKKNKKTRKKHVTFKMPVVDKHTVRLKDLNCSPAVKGKTPVQSSCFTVDVLHKLKISYNKHHPTEQIHTNDPSRIWHDLKERMSYCGSEDCWLDEIEDPVIRKKLDNYIFAPDQPKEWKKDPNSWLSNFDIFDVLEQYEFSHPNFKVIRPTPIDFDAKPMSYGGQCVSKDLCAFSVEKLMKSGKTKIAVIFNLAKHDKPGTHWVSLFIDLDDKYIFYLDSAGETIPDEIDELKKRVIEQCEQLTTPITMTYYENYPLSHQMGNNECGMYALYFIITMLTGRTENKRFAHFNDKIHFFKNKRIPDRYVNKYRKIYFNV